MRELAGAPSTLAVTAAVFGGLGLCLIAPALVAIPLGYLELGRIRRGKASPAGRGWAQAAVTLGFVALVLGALVLFAVAT